jgi:hypothetical protein
VSLQRRKGDLHKISAKRFMSRSIAITPGKASRMRVEKLAMATATAITQTGPNKSSLPALLIKEGLGGQ